MEEQAHDQTQLAALNQIWVAMHATSDRMARLEQKKQSGQKQGQRPQKGEQSLGDAPRS
ncbi:hypothetical protein F2Q70_00009133 [Brassica cretica]|uniref:Uncharacterized protein n=1 Tax=Brassica cretica TaxID=69181 RepID=A0A8S9M4B5_BRACR|nr:hypothetical protein F2Q70_00009133 [Brassica cretica]